MFDDVAGEIVRRNRNKNLCVTGRSLGADLALLVSYFLAANGIPVSIVYLMERTTEEDIWENYLAFRPDLTSRILSISGATGPNRHHLKYNHINGIIMARLHYWRVSEQLPAHDDIPALASYGDEYYNGNPEKGFPKEFVRNYPHCVDGV